MAERFRVSLHVGGLVVVAAIPVSGSTDRFDHDGYMALADISTVPYPITFAGGKYQAINPLSELKKAAIEFE